ncbi:MAG: spore coat protein CotJB [Lachnospiraceae bacterium]|nr:spore coat protein CotJB [Lachnospiraceae bacterium]
MNRDEAVYGNGRTMHGAPQGRMMAAGRGTESYGRSGGDGRMGRGSNMQGSRGMTNSSSNPNERGMANGYGNPNSRGMSGGRGFQGGRGAVGSRTIEASAECGCVTEEVTDCGCVTNESADCDCVDYSDIPIGNEAKLLAYIDEVSFCAYDVMLYLDTHPTDENAQEYFRKSNSKRDRAIDIYEEKYGPLRYGQTTVCGTGSVKWVTQSWPWEGGVC